MLQKSPGIWRQPVPGDTCYLRAQQSFGSKLAADQYPSGYPASLKGLFERAAVTKMLSLLPAQGYILDCPSGTGRVAELLLQRGFHVMASDVSSHMVDRCRENMLARRPADVDRIAYRVGDITAMSFASKSFDGVICNRLLHHYDDSEIRVRALTEMARVSCGAVIASFTNSASVSVARKRVIKALSGATPRVRAISCEQMAAEFESAGLRVIATHAVMAGFSRMCYMAGIPR